MFIIIVGEYYTLSEGGFTTPPEGKESLCKYQVEGEQSRSFDNNRQYKYMVSIKPEYDEQLVPLSVCRVWVHVVYRRVFSRSNKYTF